MMLKEELHLNHQSEQPLMGSGMDQQRKAIPHFFINRTAGLVTVILLKGFENAI